MSTEIQNDDRLFPGGLGEVKSGKYWNHRKVAKLNTNGSFIESFESIASAAKSVNGFEQNVSGVCSGKLNCKTAYGYKWKFI